MKNKIAVARVLVLAILSHFMRYASLRLFSPLAEVLASELL